MEYFTKPIERLSYFSEQSGISLNKIAIEIGVSNSYFSKMVRNRANMGSDIIEKILRTYENINPEWFILGSGEMYKTKSKENVTVQNEPNKTKSKENVTVQNGNKKGDIVTKNEKYNKSYPFGGREVQFEEGSEVHEFKLKTDTVSESQQVPLYDMEAVAGLVPLFNDTIKHVPIDYIQIPNLPKCDGAIYITGDSMYPLLKSGDIVLYKRVDDILNCIFWGEMYLISVDMGGEEYVTVKYIQKSPMPDHIRLVSYNQHHDDKDVPVSKIRALAFIKASIRINSMK